MATITITTGDAIDAAAALNGEAQAQAAKGFHYTAAHMAKVSARLWRLVAATETGDEAVQSRQLAESMERAAANYTVAADAKAQAEVQARQQAPAPATPARTPRQQAADKAAATKKARAQALAMMTPRQRAAHKAAATKRASR